jgi:hypothetical protein
MKKGKNVFTATIGYHTCQTEGTISLELDQKVKKNFTDITNALGLQANWYAQECGISNPDCNRRDILFEVSSNTGFIWDQLSAIRSFMTNHVADFIICEFEIETQLLLNDYNSKLNDLITVLEASKASGVCNPYEMAKQSILDLSITVADSKWEMFGVISDAANSADKYFSYVHDISDSAE